MIKLSPIYLERLEEKKLEGKLEGKLQGKLQGKFEGQVETLGDLPEKMYQQ